MIITDKKLIPAKGKYLKNTMTGKTFGGEVILGKYDSIENYIEVDECERNASEPEIELPEIVLSEHKPQI